MKNLLLISLLSIFILSSCACYNYGVKAGGTIATINGDDTDNLDGKVGFLIGGFAELCIDDKFSVQPELLYTTQGAKYKESEGYDGKFKLNYLNVPVMARYEIVDGLSLEAGPQVGLLLSAKDEYESPGDSGEEDIKDDVKSTDFGVNFGAGYEFESGLNLGLRYNLGLSNINDFEGADNMKNQNGVFQFSVGFRF